MLDSRLVVVVIGGACVVAAGTGAYVATRHGATPTEAVAHADVKAPLPATPLVPVAEAPVSTPVSEHVAAPVPTPSPVAARPSERRPTASARRTPPASAPTPSQPVASPPPDPAPVYEELPARQPVVHYEPPAAPLVSFEELVVPADSVLGLRIEGTVSSENAQVEDRVDARVTRDVLVGGRVALPSGSRVIGNVTLVDRGGKVKERAHLAVRFHTLIMPDGTSLAIQTETVHREGESPATSSTAKIGGGAVGGAVIGGIIGGKKGAVIGGATGAGGGTAAVMAGSRKPATLPGGTTLTVRMLSPVTVTVER